MSSLNLNETNVALNSVSSITELLELVPFRLFQSHKNYRTDGIMPVVDKIETQKKFELIQNSFNIKKKEKQRKIEKFTSITEVIPYARNKYSSITESLSSVKQYRGKIYIDNTKFMSNLSQKRTISSPPNTTNLETMIAKGVSTTSTTVVKTAINSLALGSFKMMSTVLTSTIGSVLGIAVTFITFFINFKKTGGSRRFVFFSSFLLIIQTIVTVVTFALLSFNFTAFRITVSGFIIIGTFFVINEIGKQVAKYYDNKVSMQIERYYDTYLFTKVKNHINTFNNNL